ncbi:hypothetical protein C8A00DRAFT_30471 [Chaetomidium leptoderma]|uniref:Secreted protein n=1 Tax=Chaetomidium leptoderma TaxID=669021 RepID=A0AAN6VRS6_9PEZI|nr:hypothetical protein C8A00DRAFT_30471 [Chaetomidium leptoderma]
MGILSNIAILLTAASAVTAEAAAPAAPPRITSISFSGNGCVQDPKFSGSFTDPTVTFRNFAVANPGNKTVNCQVHLQASGASPGWQVALKTNVVKGHVVLTPGTAVTHYTTVYFSQDAGNTCTSTESISNNGDSNINQDITVVSKADRKVWSPCTGSEGSTGIMNINFRSALTGDGKAFFEANTEEWDLEWRRC